MWPEVTTVLSSPHERESDIRLWVIALGMSLAINVMIALALAFWVLDALSWEIAPSEEDKKQERVAVILPEWKPVPQPSDQEVPKKFTRTSPDQTAPAPPEKSAFEGERNTQATSDRSAILDAPELPSQAGIEPRDPEEFETTESQYQDGRLDQSDPSLPATAESQPFVPPPASLPEPVAEPTKPVASENMQPSPASPPVVPPQREKAFEGPNPVEVAAQADATPSKEPPSEMPVREESPPAAKAPESLAQDAPKEKPKPVSRANDPAFSGFQQKTAITGSISRTGRSALDVEDTPAGRYHAAISRAVELEWQRNCVRHRDFITPGFLTVRFFVEPSGKVRSVQFVGDMETGEVQKGFTLNSIRDAPIPAMPDALRKAQKGEPLELVFRFYF